MPSSRCGRRGGEGEGEGGCGYGRSLTCGGRGRYNELMFLIDTCQAGSMFATFYSPNIVAAGSSAIDEDSLSVSQWVGGACHDHTLSPFLPVASHGQYYWCAYH